MVTHYTDDEKTFSSNSEAFASELLENIKDMFKNVLMYLFVDTLVTLCFTISISLTLRTSCTAHLSGLKSPNTQYFVTYHETKGSP